MSSHATHDAPHPPPAAGGEESINMGRIIAVGVVSLLIFALSAVSAFVFLRVYTARLQAAGAESLPARAIGQAEIGIVDQVHFDADRRLETWQTAQRKRLSSYGWTDRQRGLIHIPIEEAMRQVISQAGGEQAP